MQPSGLALALCTCLAGGCLGVAGDELESGRMPVLPSEDPAATDPARAAMLERLRTAYPEMRRLKADLSIGETHAGLLAEPPDASPAMQDERYAAAARALVAAVNADRELLYAQDTAGYRSDVDAQIAQQLPELRRQAVEQLCAQLPAGQVCEQIAAEVIDAALQVALQKAVDAAMTEIAAQVRLLYADFWQTRTSAPGEWIEVATSDGGWAWQSKP